MREERVRMGGGRRDLWLSKKNRGKKGRDKGSKNLGKLERIKDKNRERKQKALSAGQRKMKKQRKEGASV